MKSKVLIIRSTSILKDSRTIKLINELLNFGYDVETLGWDRLGEYDSDEMDYKFGGKTAKIFFFKQKCQYGAGLKNINNFIKFRKWIKQQIKKRDDNYIIHACDFDTASVAFKAKGGKKFIYDIYDYFSESRNLPKIFKNIISKSENKIINASDAVIICSEQRIKQIEKTNPKKLFVIHNTPNINNICSDFKLKSSSNKTKVAYVGVLSGNRLLKEILEKSSDFPDIELHIGGVGELENEVKSISQKQDNVFYYGSMPYDDVLALERNCDILFATYNPNIPNHKYSAPNKFYEAGALSKPVIVCKNTGIDEVVESGGVGFAIQYDADEFYNVINKLAKDKNMLLEYGKRGHEVYLKNYSWEEMKKRIKSLYDYVEGL